jgi:hypothetical protein
MGFENSVHTGDRYPSGEQFYHKLCTFTGKWAQTFIPKEVHELRIPMCVV